MRTLRIAILVVLGLVLALVLFGAGHSVSADTQAAAKPTATPISATTNGTNPQVTSSSPSPALIPATGSGGTSSNAARGLSRLPGTGGASGGTSILPSVLLALLGICAVVAGRALRSNRR